MTLKKKQLVADLDELTHKDILSKGRIGRQDKRLDSEGDAFSEIVVKLSQALTQNPWKSSTGPNSESCHYTKKSGHIQLKFQMCRKLHCFHLSSV